MGMSNSTTSDFLDKLSTLKNDFKVYVPSLKKEVVAKPITLKQQKDVISTTVNGVLGALQFTDTLNNVILDNVEGSNFYSFDRIPIILGLRSNSFPYPSSCLYHSDPLDPKSLSVKAYPIPSRVPAPIVPSAIC